MTLIAEPSSNASNSDVAAAARAAVATVLIGDRPGTYLVVPGTGEPDVGLRVALAELNWHGASIDEVELGSAVGEEWAAVRAREELHLLSIGSPERASSVLHVLSGMSVHPWIVAISSAEQASLVELAGFRHVMFTGDTDFFLAPDRVELADNLAHNVRDNQAVIRRWRGTALEGWHARSSLSQPVSANQELLAMKQTLSWRVTRPLRLVRRLVPGRMR